MKKNSENYSIRGENLSVLTTKQRSRDRRCEQLRLIVSGNYINYDFDVQTELLSINPQYHVDILR